MKKIGIVKGIVIILVNSILLILTNIAIANIQRAEILANTCVGCHGTYGVSHGPATPTIAGISTEYFIEAMQEYRQGTRSSTVMTRIAKGFTDKDIEAMAHYFSNQTFIAAVQTSNSDKVAKGKRLHRKYCEKCHADGGTSAEDDAGILKGQWTPYIQYTINDFTTGGREMPRKMKKRLNKMHKREGAAGLDALLNYYASSEHK